MHFFLLTLLQNFHNAHRMFLCVCDRKILLIKFYRYLSLLSLALSSEAHPVHMYISHTAVHVGTCFSLTGNFSYAIRKSPIHVQWNKNIAQWHCISYRMLCTYLSAYAAHVFLDFASFYANEGHLNDTRYACDLNVNTVVRKPQRSHNAN